ncbi:MAG TPA: protein-L-isoaspartate O-methyltransferase [Elusimicrobia bacterium]|nr:MAG: protein-L-isoaspartate O-methyltransferase [Elusimicrobia bacterium GWF2_62_30]HBA60748.1 protein-L-isoaspartate O-methyltransferase [Elusimicrobiota bacterium]
MIQKILGPKYDAYVEFVRRQMIKDQIEARGVKDPRVLAAMQKVCRHCFVPEDLVTRAYEDYPLPIGLGQTVSQPYIVALMSELLELKGPERVLEIGTGSGYQAAVLAELAAEVCTVEIHKELAQTAKARLDKLGYTGITFFAADGAAGRPDKAPFDAILAACAPLEIPPALTEQLKDGGRLVIPVGPEGAQKLVRLRKHGASMTKEEICSVSFVPMLLKKQ